MHMYYAYTKNMTLLCFDKYIYYKEYYALYFKILKIYFPF